MALQTQKQDTALQPTRTRYSFATNKNKIQLCNQQEQEINLQPTSRKETALQPIRTRYSFATNKNKKQLCNQQLTNKQEKKTDQ